MPQTITLQSHLSKFLHYIIKTVWPKLVNRLSGSPRPWAWTCMKCRAALNGSIVIQTGAGEMGLFAHWWKQKLLCGPNQVSKCKSNALHWSIILISASHTHAVPFPLAVSPLFLCLLLNRKVTEGSCQDLNTQIHLVTLLMWERESGRERQCLFEKLWHGAQKKINVVTERWEALIFALCFF